MAASFAVHDHDFPIVQTVYPDRMTMETLAPYFAAYEDVLALGRPFVSIVDMRPCGAMPSADVRREIAEWGKRVAAPRERFVKGVSFIVERPLLRAALAVVHWQAPPRQPTRVFKDSDPALDFVVECLRAHSISVPRTCELLRHELRTGDVRRSREIDIRQIRQARSRAQNDE